MTKVKVGSKSVKGGSKSSSVAQQGINATSSNTSKGKIQKYRKNTKGEKMQWAENEYTKSYYQIQSRIGLCFVKIKRDKSLLNNNISKGDTIVADQHSQHTTALQDQCTISMGVREASTTKSLLPNEVNGDGTKCDRNNNANMNSNFKNKLDNQSPNVIKRLLKESKYSKIPKCKYGNVTALKKCVVRVKRLEMSGHKEFCARNRAKESLLVSQIISPSLDDDKRKAFQKLSLSLPCNFRDKNNDLERSTSSVSAQDILTRNSKHVQKATVVTTPMHNADNETTRKHNTRQYTNRRSVRLSTTDPRKKQNKPIFKPNKLHNQCTEEAPGKKNHINVINNSVILNEIVENNVEKARLGDACINSSKIGVDIESQTVLSNTKEYDSNIQILNYSKSENNSNIPEPTNASYMPQKGKTGNTAKMKPPVMCGRIEKIMTLKQKPSPQSSSSCSIGPDKKGVAEKPGKINHTKVKEGSIQTTKLSPIVEKTTPGRPKKANKSAIFEFHPQRNSTMHFEQPEKVTAFVPSVEVVETLGTTSQNTFGNKTNRFFHRNDKETSQNNQTGVINPAVVSAKRSSQARREQVYEFLSQSQTSNVEGVGQGPNGSNVDPAADIIKKLIAEGKVSVATAKKGKGKLFLKRNRRKNVNTIKEKAASKKHYRAHSKAIGKKVKDRPHAVSTITEDDAENFEHNFIDNNANDDPIFEQQHHSTPASTTKTQMKTGQQRYPNADQDGTFSSLARSVLISQAGRADLQRHKAQRLLNMAKKLISTPKSKTVPSLRTTINADISPIQAMITSRTISKASPWRVDEDAHMPRIFNFSRSSGNLPSFSSDFIPPTPKKTKSNVSNSFKRDETPLLATSLPSYIQEEGVAPISNQAVDNCANSKIVSFSSNDSNAENKSPPESCHQAVNDENSNIFNLKQLPNPRRALNYRSPLKAINITEVVLLPPLEMSKVLNVKRNGTASKASSSKEDLFGFEDFLSQTQNSSPNDESVEANNTPVTIDLDKSLKEKRHGLRRLKPDNMEMPINTTEKSTGNEKVLESQFFTDAQFHPKTQRTLKEMFKSTVLSEHPALSSRQVAEMQRDNTNQDFDTSSVLFKDLEPETTFNEEDPHRTYMKPFKRKRRLKENCLIYEFESDASENEEGTHHSPRKKKPVNNHSHDTDTSSEKQPPNKKKKRQRKEKPELLNFVDEFNEMCKEVENYELIVEKSA